MGQALKRFTQKDWNVIAVALAFIAAGDLDECEFDAADFEAVLDKVNERRK